MSPLDDVEELGQLVEAPAPDPAADGGDPVVDGELVEALAAAVRVGALALDQGGHVLLMAARVGVDAHAAELVEGELPFPVADPPLAEEGGAAAVEADRDGDADQERAEQEDQARAKTMSKQRRGDGCRAFRRRPCSAASLRVSPWASIR